MPRDWLCCILTRLHILHGRKQALQLLPCSRCLLCRSLHLELFLCVCTDVVTRERFHDGVVALVSSRDTSCLTRAAVIVPGVDAGSGTLCGDSEGVVLFTASVALFLHSHSPE